MHSQSKRPRLVPVLFAVLVALSAPASASDIIPVGWDLFETTQFALPTEFGLLSSTTTRFVGAPLGSFDFGMGAVATFSTDTIVMRLMEAQDLVPVPIEMLARRLISEDGTLFLTLQSERGGGASTGTFTILIGPEPGPPTPGIPQPQHGTFHWSIDMAFDIRTGSFSGPILFSGIVPLTATSAPWSHFPPVGAVQIPGVNVGLNGQNQENDFWPIGQFAGLTPATVPEPMTAVLVGSGLAFIGIVRRKRR